MTDKWRFYSIASCFFLVFVILGYCVKFFPDIFVGFDNVIQTNLRGGLPESLTRFWKTVTMISDPEIIIILVGVLALIFYLNKWKAESGLMIAGMGMLVILSTVLKKIYARPRPVITHLVKETSYSFPSNHTAASSMFAGILAIICWQHIRHRTIRQVSVIMVVAIGLLVGVSRVYLGVHYPTDIIGGWLLSAGLLCLIYPTYDQLRFKWRFSSKQV